MVTWPALEQEPLPPGRARLPLTIFPSAMSVVCCFCFESYEDCRRIAEGCLSVRAMIFVSAGETTDLSVGETTLALSRASEWRIEATPAHR
jgi:hypothetical protein